MANFGFQLRAILNINKKAFKNTHFSSGFNDQSYDEAHFTNPRNF